MHECMFFQRTLLLRGARVFPAAGASSNKIYHGRTRGGSHSPSMGSRAQGASETSVQASPIKTYIVQASTRGVSNTLKKSASSGDRSWYVRHAHAVELLRGRRVRNFASSTGVSHRAICSLCVGRSSCWGLRRWPSVFIHGQKDVSRGFDVAFFVQSFFLLEKMCETVPRVVSVER